MTSAIVAAITTGEIITARIITLGQKNGEIRRDLEASDLALAYQKGVLGTLLFCALQENCDLNARLEDTYRDFWAAAAARKG
jgi:hypothetical protein